MNQILRVFMLAALVGAMHLAAALPAAASEVTIHGATYFADDHVFNKALSKFVDLTREYSGEDVKGLMHPNGELGTEKDYLAFMSQGISVDYAVVAPGQIANFAPSAPLWDIPFLFRDKAHWKAVMSSNVFAPIEKQLAEAADVMVIGYVGGGTRNLISDHAITSFDTMQGFKMRVMGAPIHAKMFGAFGIRPSVISYNEVYNAIQTKVVEGLENEAASLEQRKFYEVAPHIALSGHIITVRPILFSGKTFRSLSKKVQNAILRAGREAGEYARELESSQDGDRLNKLVEKGLVKVHEIKNRDRMIKLAQPIRQEYAAEINATEILTSIDAL